MRQLRALWNDECGFIISAELVLIATLCVLGLIAGLTLVRDSVAGEFTDIAAAFRSLDQSYAYSGFRARKTGCGYYGGYGGAGACKAWTAGSCFNQTGEQCVAEIQSFGTCREVAPAAPAPVVTPVCPPVVTPSVVTPPPAAPVITCPPQPIVCPPAPTYCPTPVEICPPACPTPLYVPQ